MSFLAPGYLLGLIGLAVPVAIHLWSNREGRVIKVGSIRFFPVRETNRSRSIRLNEIWLLVIRCIAISILVMILARPQFPQSPDTPKKVVLIEKSLLSGNLISKVLDSLRTREHHEIRLLESGFPLVDGSDAEGARPGQVGYWQLLPELKEMEADSVTIFSTSRLREFRGKRPEVSVPVKWYTVPDGASMEFVADAYLTADGIRIVHASTSEDHTHIRYQTFGTNGTGKLESKEENGREYVRLEGQDFWVEVKEPLKQEINIWYEADFIHDAYYLEAALKAIEQYLMADFTISRQPVSSYTMSNPADLTIWLSEMEYDAGQRKQLRYYADELSPFLIEPVQGGWKYKLTRRLSSRNVFEMDLSAQLLPLVTNPKKADSLLALYDQRVLNGFQTEPKYVPSVSGSVQNKAEIPYVLWIIFSTLFVAERWLSFIRKQ